MLEDLFIIGSVGSGRVVVVVKSRAIFTRFGAWRIFRYFGNCDVHACLWVGVGVGVDAAIFYLKFCIYQFYPPPKGNRNSELCASHLRNANS